MNGRYDIRGPAKLSILVTLARRHVSDEGGHWSWHWYSPDSGQVPPIPLIPHLPSSYFSSPPPSSDTISIKHPSKLRSTVSRNDQIMDTIHRRLASWIILNSSMNILGAAKSKFCQLSVSHHCIRDNIFIFYTTLFVPGEKSKPCLHWIELLDHHKFILPFDNIVSGGLTVSSEVLRALVYWYEMTK